MNKILAAWNVAPGLHAQAEVLPCNGSDLWAEALCARRPFASEAALFTASDEVWRALGEEAQQQAFDSHPRLGETHAKAASATSLAWSRGEQSALASEDAVRAELAEANRLYEARFGRIFLLCASGKGAAAILAEVRRRMDATPEAEWAEAVEQQRRTTRLRLRKWLEMPPARCEDV